MDNRYFTYRREPFYDVALKYLPDSGDSTILEIGPGDGSFIVHGNLTERFRDIHVVEQSVDSVKKLAAMGVSHIHQQSIDRGIPLDDQSVDFIHCSHLIEHLEHQAVYRFLHEVDRVLKPGGFVVISAPMIYPGFYNDLSHVRPYQPAIFISYMCQRDPRNRSGDLVEGLYEKKDLVFRYTPSSGGHFLVGERWLGRFMIKVGRRLFRLLGLRPHVCSGFTIVLEKTG